MAQFRRVTRAGYKMPMGGGIVDVPSTKILVNLDTIALVEELDEGQTGKTRLTFIVSDREGGAMTLNVTEDLAALFGELGPWKAL